MEPTKRKRTKPRYDSYTVYVADEFDVSELGARTAMHLTLEDSWGHIGSILRGFQRDVATIYG